LYIIIAIAYYIFKRRNQRKMNNNQINTDYLKHLRIACHSVKVGIVQDATHRVRLTKLLRFPSSHTVTALTIKTDDKDSLKMTTLEQYVERMKPAQEQIYYMGGPNIHHIASSPLVENVLRM